MTSATPATKSLPDKKYLAIKSWEKYQPKLTRKGHLIREWIKDFTEKDNDTDYHRLTMTQRYLFDALCRLRGRRGENIPNDPAWASTALMVSTAERRFVRSGFSALVDAGFLIPTNERVGFLELEVNRGEERGGEEAKSKSTSVPSPSPSTRNPQPSDTGSQVERDARRVEVKFAEKNFGMSKSVQASIRKWLAAGKTPAQVLQVLHRTAQQMPDGERQPGLYLAQNFDTVAAAVFEVWPEEKAREDAAAARASAKAKAEADARIAALKDDEGDWDPMAMDDPSAATPVVAA